MSLPPESIQPLNEVQLMLLKLFSRPMSQEDIEEIRNFLMNYYEKMLHKEVEEVIDKKNITRADFEDLLNKDQRTK